ncbi:7520_t:CDS:2, partial [Cetraspora pellucida]
MTFDNLFCSVDYIGHSCIASAINTQIQTNTATISTTTLASLTISVTILPTQPTTSTTQGLYYLKIHFLSSGSVLAADQVAPNENSANVRTLPHGGLYNENNQLFDLKFPLNPIVSNSTGTFDILQNNMMLVAQNESSTAWNLISIQLPPFSPYNDSGYGKIHVKAAYPRIGSNKLAINYNEINITFQDPVSLTNGNLYIYQMSSQGDILRQIINSKICTQCQCTTRDNIVTLYVYDSTFNVPVGDKSIRDSASTGISTGLSTGLRTKYLNHNYGIQLK